MAIDIIGGLAVQRWGEPRQPRDVDVALLTGFGDEASFVDHLLEHYRPAALMLGSLPSIGDTNPHSTSRWPLSHSRRAMQDAYGGYVR
jgi:hypothetical protein